MIAIPNMEKPKNCGMCQLADKWADDNDNVTIECLIGHTFNDCPLIEIVRCGECKWWKNETCEQWSDPNEFNIIETDPDDFCSYGERRTDDNSTMDNSSMPNY